MTKSSFLFVSDKDSTGLRAGLRAVYLGLKSVWHRLEEVNRGPLL
jgi:hypothetical protein